MRLESTWWLEDDDDDLLFDSESYETPDLDLEDIFSDAIGAVGKIASAPVNMVASVLPKPLQKPFKQVSSFADPGQMLLRGAAAGVSGGAKGGVSAQARAKARAKAQAKAKAHAKAKARARAKAKALAHKRAVAKAKAAHAHKKKHAAKSDRDKLMELMISVLGVKALKPHVSAKSSGGTNASNAALIGAVSAAVQKKLGPDLAAINSRLKYADLQRAATSEHLNINNTAAFRRNVLQKLMNISTCLPQESPAREKFRKIGIMSGLL